MFLRGRVDIPMHTMFSIKILPYFFLLTYSSKDFIKFLQVEFIHQISATKMKCWESPALFDKALPHAKDGKNKGASQNIHNLVDDLVNLAD